MPHESGLNGDEHQTDAAARARVIAGEGCVTSAELHPAMKQIIRKVERGVPELIPVLGSQPAGDLSHKPGGRLPFLSARPAVTHAALKRAAYRCYQFCCLVNRSTMDVNSLPKTASRLRFEPRPFCA